MKKFLSLLLFLTSFVSFGSHLAGGDIQYKYIGDSTGVNRQYKVILRVYRDITGIGMPTTENVTVSSGCYSNINVPMTLQAGSGIVSPTLFDCVNPSPSVKTLEVYRYIGYVTLPGNCADYVFWYSNCCRPGGITNINTSNGAGNDGFYFDAKLNNTVGQNSSPIFVSEPVRAFCVGNPFSWKQSTIEYDGDSVVYSLINCREGNYPNQTDIPFDAGWNKNQPVTSNYFNINPNTGLITFLPTNQEIDVLSVLVEEYRWDTINLWWYPIGTSSRDMMISIASICNPIAMSGVQFNLNVYPIDSITGLPYKEVECGDTAFGIKFHIALDGYSINDIDFRMTNSMTSQPEAIINIWSKVNVNYETDSVRIHMFQPFNQEGNYYLYSKKGMDGNTLINKCGIPMNEFDTILIKVGECPLPPPLPDPGPIDQPLEPVPGDPLPQPVVIPNVFTPNSDNKNDLFTIENLLDWQYRELIIVNRWGQIVYYNYNYQNEWDGKVDGKPLSDGVYYGVLNISYKDIIEEHHFDVTILR